jgi:hypothetical protein
VRLLRGIVAHDEQPTTALGVATANAHESLTAYTRSKIDQQATVRRRRGTEYQRWRAASAAVDSGGREASSRIIDTHLSTAYELEI